MKNQLNANMVNVILLMSIAFLLPLSKKVMPFLIILLIGSWLMSGGLKERIRSLAGFKYVWLFVSYYLMHLCGMLYTSNMNFGWFDLEIKLSLLIFPLVLGSSPRLSPGNFKRVLKAFILGCIAAVAICMTRGLYLYIETNDVKYLLYGELSYLHHSTYFSMYLCLAICIILYYLLGDRHALSAKYQRLAVPILLLFSGFIFLLSSKSGLMMLALIVLMSIIYLIFFKKLYKAGVIVVLGIAALLVIGLKTSPFAIKRIQYVPQILFSDKEIDKTTDESIAARILIWPQAVKLIKENILYGVGTGDVKDELIKKYEAEGMTGILKRKANTHNQFLQTFVTLGVFGFLSLAIGLLIPLYYGIKQGRYIYALFLLTIIVNALTESILEVQAGVVFYAFFNSFFMFLNPVNIRENIA